MQTSRDTHGSDNYVWLAFNEILIYEIFIVVCVNKYFTSTQGEAHHPLMHNTMCLLGTKRDNWMSDWLC